MSDNLGAEQRLCTHPEAVGKRWGDPISPERQRELQDYIDRWVQEQNHGERRGPFANSEQLLSNEEVDPLTFPREVELGLRSPGDELTPDLIELTGADVYWLAGQATQVFGSTVLGLRLKGVWLDGAHLEGADLSSADLEGAGLRKTHLEGANLASAHLEGAFLTRHI